MLKWAEFTSHWRCDMKSVSKHVPQPIEIIQPLFSRITKTPTCWLWEGCTTEHGYGIFYFQSKQYRAHRVVYELLVREIPDDLCIDHLCRVKRCVNPAHLEVTTWSENSRRSEPFKPRNGLCEAAVYQKSKTHCPSGHPYKGGDVFIDSHGHRYCRICRKLRARQHRRLLSSPADC